MRRFAARLDDHPVKARRSANDGCSSGRGPKRLRVAVKTASLTDDAAGKRAVSFQPRRSPLTRSMDDTAAIPSNEESARDNAESALRFPATVGAATAPLR